MIEKLSDDRKNELISKFKDIFTKTNLDEELKTNPFANYYLYIDNDEIVGFIHFDIIYERAELIQINVLKEHQNKHIGSKMMDYMINTCKEKTKNITLEVNKNNEKAINLYRKYGFKEKTIRKGYYNGTDGILMEKEMI